MKIEKKLIAYIVIALMVGVASITPLVFLMSAKAETTTRPWFNLEVPYAYWTINPPKNNTAYVSLNTTRIWQSLVLNVSVNENAWDNLVDAKIEYFKIAVYSDKGNIASINHFVYTNQTSSMNPMPFDFGSYLAICKNASGDGTIWPYYNHTSWSMETGSGGVLTTAPITEDTISEFEQAEKLYIDVRRESIATFKGNSTVIESANDVVIQHIELKRFGDGFLYNTILPEGQLLGYNLLSPLQVYDAQRYNLGC